MNALFFGGLNSFEQLHHSCGILSTLGELSSNALRFGDMLHDVRSGINKKGLQKQPESHGRPRHAFVHFGVRYI